MYAQPHSKEKQGGKKESEKKVAKASAKEVPSANKQDLNGVKGSSRQQRKALRQK